MFTVANSNAMIPRLTYANANTDLADFVKGKDYKIDVSGAGPNYDLGEPLDITYEATGLPTSHRDAFDPKTGIAEELMAEGSPTEQYTITVKATVPAGQTINTEVYQTFVLNQASLSAKNLLDSAYVGVPYYSDALQVDASVPLDNPDDVVFGLDPGEYWWWIEIRPASGPLPAGLKINPNGTITGVPNAGTEGSYDIIVEVKAPGYAGAYINKTIEVLPATLLEDALLPEAEVGKAYVVDLEASGADNIVFEAEDLPAGLNITEDGSLYGVPEEAGSYMFTVKVSAEGVLPGEAIFALVVNEEEVEVVVLPTLTFDDKLLVAGKVGVGYNGKLEASGADEIAYAAENLPAGLSLSADGKITGTPEVAGVYLINVTASADGAESAVAAIVINIEVVVEEEPVVKFDDVIVLAAGEVDKAYNAKLTAGGAEGITFAGEDLPAGLTLAADGKISGTPTAAGSYMFVVTASADGAEASTASVIIVVSKAPVVVDDAPAATGCGSTLAVSTIVMAVLTLSLAGAFILLRKKRAH